MSTRNSVANRDIVVIGGSAGSVEALQEIVAGLSPGLKAAVFVVTHLYPRSRSILAEILASKGPLPAQQASDGAPIEPGNIYIAAPDHHLLLNDGHMRLSMGPKENYQRPSINVTFRSAAQAYGPRVIGVILTGQLDDGTSGLWQIKQGGGIAVVQHPEEAPYPSMPLSALREVEADHTVRAADIGPLLTRLTKGETEGETVRERADMQTRVVDLTCPECRGTLWEIPRGNYHEYQCRVGHIFSPRSMLADHYAAQEKALWAAVVALEEGAVLAKRLAAELEPDLRPKLLHEAEQHQAHAAQIRQLIEQRAPFVLD